MSNAEEQKREMIAEARIRALEILAAGQREADQLSAEANALALELQVSIRQVGVDRAMKLKLSELQGTLMSSGVIEQAILMEDFLFGETFY